MYLTKEEKKRIAGRARTLQERIDKPAEDGEAVDNPNEWLNEWCENVADGDKDVFRKRIKYEDLTVDECRQRIQTHEWPDDQPLPAWVDRIDDLLRFIEETHSTTVVHNEQKDLPFIHIISKISEYTISELDECTVSSHLTESAINDLRQELHEKLKLLLAHPLFIEFKTFVAENDRDLAFDRDYWIPNEPQKYYKHFVENLLENDLKSFFKEYSFLARLLVKTLQQWSEMIEEFCVRLDSDLSDLRKMFSNKEELGKVVEISSHGDPHRGGRRVFSVTFESGAKIGYKPRDMEVERRFNDFISWINSKGDMPKLYTLNCLPCGEYGWMEWVKPEECSSLEEVSRYYRRAGMIMGVFHALEFTDGHLENIIAAGTHPVVVDLETLVQPIAIREKSWIEGDGREVVQDSVLRTGLLPMYRPNKHLGDTSGFGTNKVTSTGVNPPVFTNVNTDIMELDYQETATLEGENLPQISGEAIEPESHTEEIVQGFEEMYDFLREHKGELLHNGRLSEAFTDTQIRFLYRPTAIYGRLLTRLSTPSYLRTGLKFGCKMEILAKPILQGNITQEMWKLYKIEQKALKRVDIPRFTTKTTSTDLQWETQTVKDVFKEQSIERVKRRIKDLSEPNLRENCDYLEWGFGEDSDAHPETEKTESVDKFGAEGVNSEQVWQESARDIFDRIAMNASRSEDGNPIWYFRELGPQGNIYVHPVENGLYAGRIGIGLFSAALAQVCDDGTYADFATEVVSPIVEDVDEEDLFLTQPLGGGTGLGSLIYGFTKIGEFLDESSYIGTAHQVSNLLTPSKIEEDSTYDVLNGGAGTVLGLLSLYKVSKNRDVLKKAITVGEHLLANKISDDGIPKWETTEEDRALFGFAHGTAGIAYALFRLGDMAGENRFKDTALKCIEYESQGYSAVSQNWEDRRTNTNTDFMDAWCHGRTGIGLARLGMYEIEGLDPVHRDIDRALDGIDSTILTGLDHVCCGNFGRVELLLQAGRTLDEPKYKNQARRLAISSLRRAEKEGQFFTQWQTNYWYNPGFFTGEAGIGYSLLQLADSSLPRVLLWQ